MSDNDDGDDDNDDDDNDEEAKAITMSDNDGGDDDNDDDDNDEVEDEDRIDNNKFKQITTATSTTAIGSKNSPKQTQCACLEMTFHRSTKS